MPDARRLLEELLRVRDFPPADARDFYFELTQKTLKTLSGEDADIRPRDFLGEPGGLILFDKKLPVIIVPDLHARIDFVLALLACPAVRFLPEYYASGSKTLLIDELAADAVQLLFLGDGLHSERADVWLAVQSDYDRGTLFSAPMNREMQNALAAMAVVMECKNAFPRAVHFLKGNHENILNERGGGNYPFYKYADEGRMVREYVERLYGGAFLKAYSAFEKSLPLCAVGSGFIASHAEPRRRFSREELINARHNPECVECLTWTGNGEADANAAADMLRDFFPGNGSALYFAGHRPISGLYKRARERFVQIHNPQEWQAAVTRPDRAFDFSKDFIRLDRRKT